MGTESSLHDHHIITVWSMADPEGETEGLDPPPLTPPPGKI